MKRTKKPIVFIVVAVIALFVYTACFGIYNYFGDDKNEDGSAPQPQEEEEHNPISSVDLLIAKNREGALGEVKFVFDKPHCHFALRADDRFNDEMPFGV